MRGSERKKKERTEGQGRVWCFRFYERLTHCLRGLIFTPLPLLFTVISRHASGAPSRASLCVFLLAVPPTSFVADLPTYSDMVHATMLRGSSLWDKARCTMRQQSGAAPLPAGSPCLLAIIISSLIPFPRFPFFFVFFFLSFHSVPAVRRVSR